MPSPVDKALMIVLQHEGGYQRNANDKGNYSSKGDLIGTNFGISAPVLESVRGSVDESTMRGLTQQEALDIYKKEYVPAVTRNLGVPVDSPALPQVLDMVINHGYGNAVPIIQRALGVKVDGKAGPATRKALQEMDQKELNKRLAAARKDFFNQIVQSDSNQQVFHNGWLKRAESFE